MRYLAIILMLLATALPAGASQPIDAFSGQNSVAPNGTFQASAPGTAGMPQFLFVAISASQGSVGGASAVAGGGLAWAKVAGPISWGTRKTYDLWTGYGVPNGLYPTVTVSCSAGCTATWLAVTAPDVDAASPTVQSVAASGVGTATATLAAFGSTNDRPMGFVLSPTTEDTITPGAGFTDVGDYSGTPTLMAEWQDAVDLTVNASWDVGATGKVLAVELRAATPGTLPPQFQLPLTGAGR